MAVVVETPAKRRAAKAPGFVFAALASALAALLLAALSPSQPPPPAVAEYAPEAVQAIKDAPPEQQSDSGLTAGGTGDDTADDPDEPDPEEEVAGATTSSTTSTTLPPNTERVRDCVAGRQTEDPQSPPCVPYFEGDNGGSTHRGVGMNEIKVAFPSRNDPKHFGQMLNYFNNRFELYGRKVVPAGGTCFGGTPDAARNFAIAVDKLEAFASSYYCDIFGVEYYYYDELARRGIVSINGRPTITTEATLAKNHPYQWTYFPTWDKGIRHLAELACSLDGLPARYAGPPYPTMTRKWGLLLNTFIDAPAPDYTAALAALEACGIEPRTHTVQIEREGPGGSGANEQTTRQVQTAVVDWRTNDVTSVINLTHFATTRQLYAMNDGQGYQPEILNSTYLLNDEDFIMGTLAPGQLAHSFGITTRNMQMTQVEDEFWWQAVEQGGNNGQPWEYPPGTYLGARFDYLPMLMLFSGLQLAGPHLTPEAFAAGMIRNKWSNPNHRNMPGKVTVGAGNHSFVEDAAIIWWNPGYASEDWGQRGGYCYVDGGKRRRLGQYGKGDPGLFQGRCGRGLD